jgi:hypothetical protein
LRDSFAPVHRRSHAALLWFAQAVRPFVPHETFRVLHGWGKLGYLPHYRYPRTLNEKVTWWIRNSRDPRLSERADKLAVRAFVASVAPGLRMPEVYAVTEDAASFPFDDLPDVSVLKSNHGSQQVRVLRRPFDAEAERARAAEWLRRPYGSPLWEWHYRPIPRRLYAEAYLGGPDGTLPLDYKVLVLNGRAHLVSVFVRQAGRPLRRVTFDREWRLMPLHLPLYPGGPPDVVEAALHPPRPRRLEEMLRAAEALVEDIPIVRVDFYVIDEEIYFGELTFMPSSGYAPYSPVSYDWSLGALVDVGSDRPWWTVRRPARRRPVEGAAPVPAKATLGR